MEWCCLVINIMWDFSNEGALQVPNYKYLVYFVILLPSILECYLPVGLNVEICICILRFTKDLKPQDINRSFFSGNGELNNLELDPNFLNEILQLPPWIEFQSAICDNIKAKVNCITLHAISLVKPDHFLRGAALIRDYKHPLRRGTYNF